MTNPKLITTAFAENGTANDIPESSAAEPQLATMSSGFPDITQKPIAEGGIPPERADFNGILKLYGQHIVHLNKGLGYEFDADFATAIGGYPLHARIVLTNGNEVKNTIPANTTNPNTDMTGWELTGGARTDAQLITWSGITQEDKNKEVISILDFGGKADTTTDNSIAMNKAYRYSESVGGCTIKIPCNGNNTYIFKDYVNAASNTTVIVDDPVTLDLSQMKTGESTDGVWKFKGSIGGEVNLSQNATRGDTRLIVNNHGLSVGDYALLKSQRNAFSLADSGAEWKLGRPTTTLNHHALYFGEPIIVKNVISENEIELVSGLIFPSYRIDKTQETSSFARPCSTIQKLNFMKDSYVKGGKVVCDGSTAFRSEYALRCMAHNIQGFFGNNVGSLFHANMSYLCGVTQCKAYRSSGDWVEANLSQFNSFKQRSSWFCIWDYEDHNGSQGFDSSYNLNGVPSLLTYILNARGYNQKVNALTFHSGSYGYYVHSLYSVGHQNSALYLRSRSGVINSLFLESTALSGSHIRLDEYAVDVDINGGYVEGGSLSTGFVIGGAALLSPSDSIPESQAIKKNITLNNLLFKGHVQVGVVQHPAGSDFKTTESCGVSLINVNAVGYMRGIRVYPYCNNLVVKNLTGRGSSATGALLVLDNDSVNHDVDGISAESFGAITLNRIFDTTTFPVSQYRNNGNNLKNISMTDGKSGITNTDILLRSPVASLGNMYLTPKMQTVGILQIIGSGTGTLRLPRTVESIPLKPFVLVNTGTGVLTIVGDSTSTTVLCTREKGLTVSQGDMVTIIMTDIDKWLVS